MSKKWLVSLFSAGVISLGISAPVSADTDKDCEDFETHEEAQQYFEDQGYTAENDPERLDGYDEDGLACESLPEGDDTSATTSNDDTTEETTSTTEEETSSSNEGTTEETTTEEEASDENMTEESAEEGGEMPETATNQPAWALAGTAVAGLGALLLVRRRVTSH
ncbi:excalibur calcium-binding domain-containing protein [Marinococcus sp. PL1-022]|uniref:excalibur calcium-binding domain-containing protein n=1 Tax=Marinococcus sp. PL1-022 TaxID=3095363 RepID=UPI0029C4A9CD|nr:excalibur calcium-binding domain-containing protein [Marinococcus sp. PL1-022]MDX6153568.1 excalibur calcium-binding domain-containing protein [Marinococcus sp. PL1-022]